MRARADFGPATLRVGLRSGRRSTAVSAGIYELRSRVGFAVLTEPYATIFSHLMDRSESEIEDMSGRHRPVNTGTAVEHLGRKPLGTLTGRDAWLHPTSTSAHAASSSRNASAAGMSHR